MSRMIEAFLLCTTALATACTDVAPESDTEADAEPVAQPITQTNLICGDNTVASARTPTGNRVVFCVHDDVEVIAEGGTGERMPIDSDSCGLDLFLSLTDATTPVPARLLGACAKRARVTPLIGRTIVDEPVFTAFPEGDLALFNSAGSYGLDYCGGDGQARFSEEMSYYNPRFGCPQDHICAFWNRSEQSQTHVQAIATVLGEQGNIAKETLASCNGTTRFRGQQDRGAQDSTWVTLYDIDVPTRNSWFVTMTYYTNGEDSHFQFRGESYGAAWHRYSGTFQDRKY